MGLRESWWSLDRERWLRARPNPLRRSARLSARRALRRSALEEGEGRCLAPPGVEDRNSDTRSAVSTPGAGRERMWVCASPGGPSTEKDGYEPVQIHFVEARACPREERFGEVLSKRGRGDASHHQESKTGIAIQEALYLLPALAGSGCGSARVLVVPRPRKMVTSPSKSTSSKRAPVREKSASAKCSRRGGGAMPRTTRSRRPE